MKYIVMLFSFVVICLVCIVGCTEKNNTAKQSQLNDLEKIAVFDETMDEPVKVIYQKNYEYSALYETEDKDTINSLLNALNEIEVLSETEIAVDDYEDIITFVSANGEKLTVKFEFKRLLKNNKRYFVNGYEKVNDILLSISDNEVE